MPTRQTHTRLAVACVAFFLLAGCGSDPPGEERERPVIEDVPIETDDVSSDPSDAHSSDDENEAPTDHTADRNRLATPFRLVSNQESKEEVKEEHERKAPKLCVRLVGCEISDDSPNRDDSSLNHPPKLYVIVKNGDATIMTSSEKLGWKVKFTDKQSRPFIATPSDDMEYNFKIFDSQWGADKHVLTIGPLSGKEIVEQLLPGLPDGSKPKRIILHAKKDKVRLTLEYVGIVQWHRLANVTVPTGSPCRKPFGDEKPELEVRLFLDGKPLKNVSKETTSTSLPYGWEGTFPKSPMNCWPILEQSDARYDVEVWDVDRLNELLFKVSDLQGEKFRDLVFEKAGPYVEEEILGKVQFKSLDAPITEE